MRLKIAAAVATGALLAAGGLLAFHHGAAPDSGDRLAFGTSAPSPVTTTIQPVPPSSSSAPPKTTPPVAGSPKTSKPTPATSTKKAGPPPKQAVPNAVGTITFYAAKDNDPPGSREIAFPEVLHGQAGGTGTFADPLTFAAADGVFAPGTRIYVPDVKRYFILEDTCATCSGSHIDLWVGPATDSAVLDCEDALTHDDARPYEVAPPPTLPVTPGDLYRSGTCFKP